MTSSARGRWLPALAICIAIIMVDGFDLQAIGFVAPEMARAWGVEMAAFGPVFSAALAGSMVGAMSAGPLARRTGLWMVLNGALIVFGLGTLATAWVHSLYPLIALRFVVGLGLGAAVPLVVSIVAAVAPPQHRSVSVALTLCGQPVGALLGSVLCARMMPIYGWEFAFYLGGVLPLVLVPAVMWLKRQSIVPDMQVSSGLAPAPDNRVRDLFGPGLASITVLMWVAGFFSVFYGYIIVNWLPAALRENGYSLEQSAWAISLYNAGGIAGALLQGWLMDRFAPLRVIPIAMGLAGIAALALDPGLMGQLALFSAVFCSGLTGYGAIMSKGPLTVALYPPRLHTNGVGWIMATGRLGATISPLAAGMVLAWGLSMGGLFYLAAGSIVVAAICLALLGRVTQRV